MQSTESFHVHGPAKEVQHSTDRIHIYVNYRDYAITSSKEDAVRLLAKVDVLCPSEFQIEYQKVRPILLQGIGIGGASKNTCTSKGSAPKNKKELF